MGAVGVGGDAIADGYAQTADALESMYGFGLKNPVSRIDEVRRKTPHVAAPREAMNRLLGFVQRDFGSMRGYLEAHGARDHPFDRLVARLVDRRREA